MMGSNLGSNIPNSRDETPLLLRVEANESWHRVKVQGLHGYTVESFENKAGALAVSFGSRSCQVYETDRKEKGTVWLEFARGEDKLEKTIPALAIPNSIDEIDYKAIPIGLTDHGDMWNIQILETHTLIAGLTGAGKGSVWWSIVRGLLPAIRDGHVELWGIDPKGGMELGFGRDLFTRYCSSGDLQEISNMLQEASAKMKERTNRFEGVKRLHEPDAEDPLIIIFIDEFSRLTAKMANTTLQTQIRTSLAEILNMGRAPGVSIIAALQTPTMEVNPLRDDFNNRVALALAAKRYVDMVLLEDARDRGALCDEIDYTNMPGTGYVINKNSLVPIRVRAANVTDDQIKEMARDYKPTNPSQEYETGDDGPVITKKPTKRRTRKPKSFPQQTTDEIISELEKEFDDNIE
jgi:S-DNA-T family DNA segregation ATPase FtsK/SpoIIIE